MKLPNHHLVVMTVYVLIGLTAPRIAIAVDPEFTIHPDSGTVGYFQQNMTRSQVNETMRGKYPGWTGKWLNSDEVIRWDRFAIRNEKGRAVMVAFFDGDDLIEYRVLSPKFATESGLRVGLEIRQVRKITGGMVHLGDGCAVETHIDKLKYDCLSLLPDEGFSWPNSGPNQPWEIPLSDFDGWARVFGIVVSCR